MAQLNTIIILRSDSTTAWESSSYKLRKGEVGIEFLENNKVKMKVGIDGQKTWSELPYFGGENAHVYETTATSLEEDSLEVLESYVGEASLNTGDIGIVKAPISEGKYQYTAYVFNGSEWAAMDGNYSASNVFLKNTITLAGDFDKVGNYSKGDTIAAGTSLESVLSGILQQELEPSVDYPSVSISANGGSGEVGSSYTVPTAILKVTDVGSYTYGPATGISFAIGNMKLAEGSDPATATNYVTNTGAMVENSTLTLKASGDKVLYADTSKSYTFSGVGIYTDGAIPKTNLNNDCASKQIKSDSVEIANKTVSFFGYRYAFAGGTSAASIDSAVVRSMEAKKNSKTSMDAESEALTFSAAAGTTKVFFAYPSTWSGTPYFEMFGLAWAQNSNFVAKDNIQVADYRGTNEDGTLNGATAYKLYAWELDTPLAAENTNFRVWFK